MPEPNSSPQQPNNPQDASPAQQEPASPTFTVQDGDQKRQMTADELIEHAQKGLEYEHKSQELKAATQAIAPLQELQRLIEANPTARTQLATALRAANADPKLTAVFADPEPPPKEAGPHGIEALAQRLNQLEASLSAQRQSQAIADLQSRYGAENVDQNALLAAAKEMGISDLDAVYKLLTYDQVKEQAVKEYLEGKRRQSTAPFLPSGPSPDNQPTPPKTFAEARQAAMAYLRNAQQHE